MAHDSAPAKPHVFDSFWMGGFEAATHINDSGRRLDMLAATQHDQQVDHDYALLRSMGIRTVRDAVRWHLIERDRRFDFSSLAPMVVAAERHGMQVMWTLLHYGVPDDVDFFSPEFPARFARFSAEVARFVQSHSKRLPFCTMDNGASVGIAMTGPEGVIGIGALTGATETFGDVVSHSAGSGHALSVDSFQREVDRCETFHDVMKWYSHECLREATQSVACNALHSANERTARWLLMMADRSGREDCRVTHDGLALILGLRRATVTIALRRLTDMGTLMPFHGGLRIADRRALEAAACECWRKERGDRESSSSDEASIVRRPSFVDAQIRA